MIAAQELVTVLVPADAAQQMLAESALEEAGIPHGLRNSDQGVHGASQAGGVNLIGGPIEIQVAGHDAERAESVLAEALAQPDSVQSGWMASELTAAQSELAAMARSRRYSVYSLVWAVLSFYGIGSILAVVFGVKALRLLRGAPDLPKTKAVFGLVLGALGVIGWALYWIFPQLR